MTVTVLPVFFWLGRRPAARFGDSCIFTSPVHIFQFFLSQVFNKQPTTQHSLFAKVSQALSVMNFLAQATPLTPNKHRSSMGLFASELSLSPLDCTPHHPQNQNEEACTTPPRGSPNKVSRTPPTSSSKPDRFIPNRNNIDFDYCHNQLFCHAGFDENIWNEQGSHETPRPTRSSMTATEHMLNAEVLRELQTSSNKRMMSFANNHDSATSPPHTGSPLGLKRPLSACLSPKLSSPHKKSKRMLPAGPCKILDAPGTSRNSHMIEIPILLLVIYPG